MEGSTARFGFVLACLLLAFPAFAYDVNGTEDRCVELGAGCICAETLNDDFDLTTYPGRHWDPASSVDSIECNGEPQNGQAVTLTPEYDGGSGGNSSQIQAATEAPFPSGANPYVYKSAGTGVSHIRNVEGVAINNQTLCIRIYRKWNPGFTMTSNAHRVKNIELARINDLGNFSHINYEHNWDGSTFFHTTVDNVHGLDGNAPAQGGWQTRCNQNWCRLEICADHNGSANTINYRFSMTDLGDGANYSTSFGPGSSPGATYYWQEAQLFVQGSPPGYSAQYASHMVVARAPYNPSFTIGAAYELENITPVYFETASAPASVPENTQFTVECQSTNNVGAVTYTGWECTGDGQFNDTCVSNPQPNQCVCSGVDVAQDTLISVGCEGNDTATTSRASANVLVTAAPVPSTTGGGVRLGDLHRY